MYSVEIFTCPNTGILTINISRQVKPRLVREPSVAQNAPGNRLAGGSLLRVVTIRRTTDTHYRHTLQTHTTDTFLFISRTTNVLLFKFRCNIFIGFRIIKEMPGSVASGKHCIYSAHIHTHTYIHTHTLTIQNVLKTYHSQ